MVPRWRNLALENGDHPDNDFVAVIDVVTGEVTLEGRTLTSHSVVDNGVAIIGIQHAGQLQRLSATSPITSTNIGKPTAPDASLTRAARLASMGDGRFVLWKNGANRNIDQAYFFFTAEDDLANLERAGNMNELPMGRGSCVLPVPAAWSDIVDNDPDALFFFGGDGPSDFEGIANSPVAITD